MFCHFQLILLLAWFHKIILSFCFLQEKMIFWLNIWGIDTSWGWCSCKHERTIPSKNIPHSWKKKYLSKAGMQNLTLQRSHPEYSHIELEWTSAQSTQPAICFPIIHVSILSSIISKQRNESTLLFRAQKQRSTCSKSKRTTEAVDRVQITRRKNLDRRIRTDFNHEKQQVRLFWHLSLYNKKQRMLRKQFEEE
jgi:hypothetical protein